MLAYSIGDVVDRLSILCLKMKYLKEYSQEHELFEQEYQSFLNTLSQKDQDHLKQKFTDILSANNDIWQLESDIRKKKELPLSEVGSRALKIRDFNEVRVKIKNDLNLYFNQGYKEIKI